MTITSQDWFPLIFFKDTTVSIIPKNCSVFSSFGASHREVSKGGYRTQKENPLVFGSSRDGMAPCPRRDSVDSALVKLKAGIDITD